MEMFDKWKKEFTAMDTNNVPLGSHEILLLECSVWQDGMISQEEWIAQHGSLDGFKEFDLNGIISDVLLGML